MSRYVIHIIYAEQKTRRANYTCKLDTYVPTVSTFGEATASGKTPYKVATGNRVQTRNIIII